MSVKGSIKTTVNQRAEFAYKCVRDIARDNADIAKKYKAYSKRLMAMIRINGLLATITFIKGKGSSLDAEGKAYKRLYKDIGEWLKSTDCPVNSVYDTNKRDLMDIVVSLNSDEYRVTTKEIMEFVNWLRRFAKGMIGDEN